MWPLSEGNIQVQALRAAKNFELGVLPAAMQVELLTKKRKACGSLSIHSDNNVLSFQPRKVRGSAWHNIGNNHSVIARQVQSGSQFRRDGLKNSSDFRFVDVTVLYKLRIGECHDARRDREAQTLI